MKNKLLICLVSSLLLFSCNTKKPIVISNFDFANHQLKHAIAEIDSITSKENKERVGDVPTSPRTIDKNGNLSLVKSKDWTSGFFPGELWYMYEYTKDEYWKNKAIVFTKPIEKEKTNATTHDMGFKVYCSFGNGYRLTKDSAYRDIIIESAYTLVSRYKENAGILRSWDFSKDKWQCPVIIDNMMNLELLFWAFKETKDPKFYLIAVNHAHKTMENHFRDDYSSYHVVDYDTLTSEVIGKQTHQGYADESSWARGQAWAIYGYTMCFRETKDIEFLEHAKNVVNYTMKHKNMPEDLIPYWDFDAPEIPNEPRDASAASCIASALYELSLYSPSDAVQYKAWADTIMENLTNKYRAKLNSDRGFLLLHSTGSKPSKSEVDVPLVYADYYFLEALLRKQNIETKGSI